MTNGADSSAISTTGHSSAWFRWGCGSGCSSVASARQQPTSQPDWMRPSRRSRPPSSELRLLAHGIRPSSLDDGLAAALAHLAQNTTLPLTLDLQGDDDLPDAVTTTAYFVAAEAVTNAVRYAEADHILVRLRREADELTVQINDNGLGGARPRPGSGLTGLKDRVSGAGGCLRVVSPPGGGTLVEARLPCGS